MRLRLALLVLLLTTALSAAPFATPQAAQLAERVTRSFAALQGGGDFRSFDVTGIETAYASLPRARATADQISDLAAAKYLVSHWRSVVGRTLVARFSEAPKAAAETLLGLSWTLRADVQDDLVGQWIRRDDSNSLQTLLAHLFAVRGALPEARTWVQQLDPTQLSLLGPGLPLRSSPIFGAPFAAPASFPASPGSYRFVNAETVEYRGILWRSGRTVFLLDHHIPFDGMNTCFSEPRSCFTHVALFVVIPFGPKGELHPGFIEVFEKGLRFVPLENYLDASFAAYGEALELPATAAVPADVVRTVATRLATGQLGYDFSGASVPDSGRLAEGCTSVVCSTLVDLLLRESGGFRLDLPELRDRIVPGAQRNLDALGGFPVREYFTPTSLLRHPALQFVGVVDNDLLAFNVTREIVFGAAVRPSSFGGHVATRRFDVEYLRNQLEVQLVQGLIRGVGAALRGPAPVRKPAELLTGLTADTFSRATPLGLATILLLQRRVGSAVKNFVPRCSASLSATEPLFLPEWETREAGRLDTLFRRHRVERIFR